MAPKFENEETRRLAAEVARLADESEDEAVRKALRERHARLELEAAKAARAGGGERRPRTKDEFRRFMETKIWPLIPDEHRGGPPMTRAERAELLGYGPDDD